MGGGFRYNLCSTPISLAHGSAYAASAAYAAHAQKLVNIAPFRFVASLLATYVRGFFWSGPVFFAFAFKHILVKSLMSSALAVFVMDRG